MRVLVTGATGFLGGHLVPMLVEAGHEVRALVRRTSRTGRLDELGVETVLGDLADADSLARAAQGVEALVHAAATMSGPPRLFEAATVEGTRALLEAAERAGVRRFVHVSSVGIYRMAGATPAEPLEEDAPLEDDPVLLTNYTRSKLAADRAAQEFAERDGVDVLILRLGILYGPGGRWNLPRMGYALGRALYVLIGRGRNPLPVCYVGNAARAVVRGLEAEEVRGGAFNILDDETFTPREYLQRIKRDVRPRLSIVACPYAVARALSGLSGLLLKPLGRSSPLHPAQLIVCHRPVAYSNARAKERLGWRPETGRAEALARTMEDLGERERLSRRADPSRLGRAPAGLPPLTACVIGCGGIAREHLRILARMPNARLAAICDVDVRAAAELAEEFAVPRTYDNAEAMLEAERPDVVHVLTPPQTHLELARAAFEAGAHVLVEKPMAVDAGEARRMAEAARAAGLQLCVDHNHVYDPVIVRLRRLIGSGALGQVIWAESYYGFNLGDNRASKYMMPGGREHWTFGLPGGLLQNLAPHPLCLALDVLGPEVRTTAHARYGRVLPHAPADELRVLLESEEASGMVTVSLAVSPRFQYLNVLGTRGSVFVDILNQWLVRQRVLRGVPKPVSRALLNVAQAWTILRGTLGGMLRVLRRRWTPYVGMETLIREFYASVQEGREPPVTAEEGVRVMEVMDAVWRIIGEQS